MLNDFDLHFVNPVTVFTLKTTNFSSQIQNIIQ